MFSYTEVERELVPALEARSTSSRAGVAIDVPEEARLLVRHVAASASGVTGEEREQALALAARRREGTPLALLVGYEEFLGSRYEVTPGVLVPHPATETLAVVALDSLRGMTAPTVAEVGHGSGQLSVEIARRVEDAEVTASDVSADARRLTESNAARLLGAGAERVRCVTAEDPRDVLGAFDGLLGKVDLLVSNPPFLSEIDPISDEVRDHTADEALYGPDGDPMHFYRTVANDARALLSERGAVVMEFHEFHRREVLRCFHRRSWTVEVFSREDCRDMPAADGMRPMTPTGHRVLRTRPSR
ncbi:N5-glutamine methyltransferase family protein [Streptomyces sp. NPDC048590]|uniref:N5-glutamine methyltransferase family protein n=1 Tax=Streptomyces sp. NPDC048590 TaxID=3365574 RepID=UPI00371173A5